MRLGDGLLLQYADLVHPAASSRDDRRRFFEPEPGRRPRSRPPGPDGWRASSRPLLRRARTVTGSSVVTLRPPAWAASFVWRGRALPLPGWPEEIPRLGRCRAALAAA